ncbi:MAG: hypothetical protein RMA76_13445 [Deltaproteobacteria bacterium]|jgi:hypothetical protein
MSNAAETIALPSPVTPEETLPQSLVGSSGAHAVYRGGPSGDVTRYGSPRPSPVHVHGASDWPDEAPTVGIAGGAPRNVRGFGVKRPSGPRALVRERADTRPPAPSADGRLPRARPDAIRPAPFDSSARVRPGRVGASVGPAAALGPVPVRPLRIDDPAEARPARAVSPFRPEPLAAVHPGERTHDIEDTTPSRQVRAYVPAEQHSSQLRLKKPSPKALASRQPTVQYMPEPETHALGIGATSLFLTAALLAGCAAGMAAFQLLI